ncbi:Acriflavin resistance protein [Rhodovulum sp. P5]|uniref:efflux RND transporter permease subunit n=1 Tax=Rhodovulum sp. P5 TaxID=1564506 RepID=UPI0009C34521|nr:efflux RND transporter permease subunit [Rhodovulum sp. P5]ARE40850.1 Acriflavin resistance protein [Rhodovulum sp. P5]
MTSPTETGVNDKPNGHPPRRLGISGWTARSFIQSPLTPLLLIAFFAIGLLGAMVTPREEDPQISVPMVDIMVGYPGASSNEVANLISEPLARMMSELSGVDHVYSMSRDGASMVTVRFDVGEGMEPSLVKLYDKLMSNMEQIPKGVMEPLVKPKSIDDVPVVTVTLSSDELDLVQLRKLGLDVQQRFKALPNTGLSFVTGGSLEQVRVEVDPSSLASFDLTLSQVAHAISGANQRLPAGNVIDGNRFFDIYTGAFLENADEVAALVVGAYEGKPVFLRDVAKVTQGVSETETIVHNTLRVADGFQTEPAVTVAVAKKYGTNGVDVASALLTELEAMKGQIIPPSVDVTVSRDYGATAHDKVSHLIMKLFIVSALVTVLALVTMGIRPAVIVLITIPAVLLMSLAVAYVLGFTINRVSMFALVFAIGILVDDAIVVVENIYRRWLKDGDTSDETTADAVDEVGNPTILATFTVVAALLPMGFVSEMMGPYMLPIPVLSSAAMVFSLMAAFIFVPWLAARVKPSMEALERAEAAEHRQSEVIAKWYSRLIMPIMNSRPLGWLTLMVIILAMCAAVAMFPLKMVAFKMLPFDNKSELQVVIDMPEGTDLFVTANLAERIGTRLQDIPEVVAYQSYVGTASPFNFNGLVRHYFLRSEPWQADIAVELIDKEERARSCHEIATEIREILRPVADAAEARLTIAETPPGPPVLAQLVAEVYGPTTEIRQNLARRIMAEMEAAPDIADVNTFMEEPHQRLDFTVDRLKAALYGISVETINREIAMAAGGFEVGALKSKHNLEQAVIVLQAPLSQRVNLGNLLVLPIPTADGSKVPLGELGSFEQVPVDPPIYHKDLRPVEYVTGEVIGPMGAPLYGMLQVDAALSNPALPADMQISGNYFTAPDGNDGPAFKWDGEWQVTYVTFRDMGLAFAAALVLIYILVVAEFKTFALPLVVMAPIPLTLIGIVPGHWLLGADFTATSMIGFIALAGIIVRNSILLVEFARAEVEAGRSVQDAITLAAQVRLRPILITALALVIGSMVLLSDPIFQGMAASLLAGSLVATFLTLVVIPLGCISMSGSFEPNGNGGSSTPPVGGAPDPTPPAPTPGKPPRLVRKSASDTQQAAIPEERPKPARPPKLQRKSASASATSATTKSDAETPARPPRLQRKSEPKPEAPSEPKAEAKPAGRKTTKSATPRKSTARTPRKKPASNAPKPQAKPDTPEDKT